MSWVCKASGSVTWDCQPYHPRNRRLSADAVFDFMHDPPRKCATLQCKKTSFLKWSNLFRLKVWGPASRSSRPLPARSRVEVAVIDVAVW